MLSLFLKCVIGAVVVLLIAVLSKSKVFYIAGLVPLFPTFALIAHVIVAQDKGAEALRQTALFGIWSLIPYFVYLFTVYILATKMPIWSCLGVATVCWIVAAVILILGWNSYFS
ncbi:GlpM family protein [Acinetobacter piscicola]|uniref:GlpM family protein n=1 Tax=Acinetobacter piscicola TaxID=2006115 RepID=UPI003556567A